MSISKWGETVRGTSPRDAFVNIGKYSKIPNKDLMYFVELYICSGIPYFFSERPLAYAAIKEHFSKKLNIQPRCIGITGSAKLGFSLSQHKWLDLFVIGKSDFDFFIISQEFFEKVSDDFHSFKSKVVDGSLLPRTRAEKIYWSLANLDNIERNINKYGFVDPHNIPNLQCFSSAMLLNRTATFGVDTIGFLLGNKEITHDKIKSSFRCYKNYISAFNRIYFNIKDACIKKNDNIKFI